MSHCTICGGTEFGPGPGGRLSATGRPPYCIGCGSLERHRLNRDVALMLQPRFGTARALQFSADRTMEADWFKSFEISIYGTETSLDLQKIDRDTGSYDIVICNHVLEHVAYDNAAMCELIRIIQDDGFVFLSFPSPHSQPTTRDWGYPNEEQHGHYRIYGIDVEQQLFDRFVPHAHVLRIEHNDPVTGVGDYVYLVCKTAATAVALQSIVPAAVTVSRSTAPR